jgi:hypothetical protein
MPSANRLRSGSSNKRSKEHAPLKNTVTNKRSKFVANGLGDRNLERLWPAYDC